MSNFQVGDKVMVVYGECSHTIHQIGNIFVIQAIYVTNTRCYQCGELSRKTDVPVARICERGEHGVPKVKPLSWLIKLPPDSESIDEKEPVEIKA